MGLAIEVAPLAEAAGDPEWSEDLRQTLERLNRTLRENERPEHHEPRDLESLASRSESLSFPYSFIHYLRRVRARSLQDESFVAEPLDDAAEPSDDPALDREYESLRSHLICHSDCEGFYVPQDFETPMITEEDGLGGCIGSSQQLMLELVSVAPALGVTLEQGLLSDEEAARINGVCENEEGLYRELTSWLTLFEAARLSIEHDTVIAFL